MYGLFINTYDYNDYHEWRDLVRISESKRALHESVRDHPYRVLDGDEQELAHDMEEAHYVIEEVELI